MALVLLVSAGLMIRTFSGAAQPSIRDFTHPEHLQTMRISIPGASLVPNPQQVTRTQKRHRWIS